MKKSDLKYGNVIETRNGDKYLVAYGHTDKVLVNLNDGIWISAPIKSSYKEDLTNVDYFDIDIMKVYKDYTLTELLWKRKEEPKPKPKLTEDEKFILKASLNEKYQWIARNASGLICLFTNKPFKDLNRWLGYDPLMCPFKYMLKFIKWEDEEPYSIEDLLGEEK